MSYRARFPEFIRSSHREELKRIWLEYSGLVPDQMLREFIGLVSGEPQPARGPVTVLQGSERIFVYSPEPFNEDKLIFMTLDEAETWAPVAVAAEIAGTWGRFEELAGYSGSSLRERLAEHSRYPDFESFRDREPNPDLDRDDFATEADETRAEAGDTEAELRDAYADLNCPHQRGPLDDDPLDRCQLITWDEERLLDYFDPLGAMCTSMPGSISREFGTEYYTILGDGPYAEYKPEDHDAIVAAFARLGITLIRDETLVGAFWGLETDLDGIVRRLEAYRDAERFLVEVLGEADDDDGDD